MLRGHCCSQGLYTAYRTDAYHAPANKSAHPPCADCDWPACLPLERVRTVCGPNHGRPVFLRRAAVVLRGLPGEDHLLDGGALHSLPVGEDQSVEVDAARGGFSSVIGAVPANGMRAGRQLADLEPDDLPAEDVVDGELGLPRPVDGEGDSGGGVERVGEVLEQRHPGGKLRGIPHRGKGAILLRVYEAIVQGNG
jgi:hypothetical protein